MVFNCSGIQKSGFRIQNTGDSPQKSADGDWGPETRDFRKFTTKERKGRKEEFLAQRRRGAEKN